MVYQLYLNKAVKKEEIEAFLLDPSKGFESAFLTLER